MLSSVRANPRSARVRDAPRVDPELRAALAARARARPTALTAGDIPALRRRDSAEADRVKIALDQRTDVHLARIRTRSDGVALTLVSPANTPTRALALYFHGGGMIAGTASTGLENRLRWVTELGIVVASVDYRLAPEHPFPAAYDDASEALAWASAWTSGNHHVPLVVVGQSAGGALAAGAILSSRARGEGPAGLLLDCPMLDDRVRVASRRERMPVGVWDAASDELSWGSLLGERYPSHVPSLAAPARTRSLRGLPPSYLSVGSVDIFRDDCIDFARRAAAQGIEVEFHLWSGGIHGFEADSPESMVAGLSMQAQVEWLRRIIS